MLRIFKAVLVLAAALVTWPAAAGEVAPPDGVAGAIQLADNAAAPAVTHGSEGPITHSFEHKPAGKVVLGVGYSGTPFAFKRDGHARGFEVDLARAMASERDFELEVRWLPRDELVPALRAGEVHMVNVGAIPGELPTDVDVVPYLVTGEHVVVRRDNPFAIHAAEDLSGTMVVATMGGPGEDFAYELRSRVSEAGKAPVEVHTMPMAHYTPMAVRFTHASAYFAPTAAVALQVAGPDAEVKIVPGLFMPTGQLGFGLRLADAELKMYVRLALAKIVAKGVYGRLLEAYYIPADCSPFR